MTDGVKARLRILFGIMLLAGIMLVFEFLIGISTPRMFFEHLCSTERCISAGYIIGIELIVGTELIYRFTWRKKQGI